jgi:hypothetical protein
MEQNNMGEEIMGELRSTFSNKSENNPWRSIEPTRPEETPSKFEQLVGRKFRNKDSGDYQVERVFSQQLGSVEQWSAALESLDNPSSPKINKPIDEATGTILDTNHTWAEIE